MLADCATGGEAQRAVQQAVRAPIVRRWRLSDKRLDNTISREPSSACSLCPFHGRLVEGERQNMKKIFWSLTFFFLCTAAYAVSDTSSQRDVPKNNLDDPEAPKLKAKVGLTYYLDSREYETLAVFSAADGLPFGLRLWGFTDIHGYQGSPKWPLPSRSLLCGISGSAAAEVGWALKSRRIRGDSRV